MGSDNALTDKLWTWSLEFYRQDGIADTLLTFQNTYDINVNLILWCLWCAPNPVTEKDVSKANERIQVFNPSVTANLRKARNALKNWSGADTAGAKALRDKILQLELEAERFEQALICDDAQLNRQPSEEQPSLNEEAITEVALENLRVCVGTDIAVTEGEKLKHLAKEVARIGR